MDKHPASFGVEKRGTSFPHPEQASLLRSTIKTLVHFKIRLQQLKFMKVHIIGGGIIGWSTAWYLQQAGYEVTIIEKEQQF